MENKVNIGMVTYNRLGLTKKSIDSILQKTKFSYKLTVVDNNSTDGTQDYLKSLYNDQKIDTLYLLPKNIGVAKASNLAWLTYPTFKYYVKFDNDIIVNVENWLSDMIKIIEAVPKIGMLGYNVEVDPWNNIKEFNGQKVRLKFQGNLGGACVLIPERTREKLGYWCEDYGLYSEEDADYGFRIRILKLYNCYMINNDAMSHCDNSSITLKTNEHQKLKEYASWKDKQRGAGLLKLKSNFEHYRKNKNCLFMKTDIVLSEYQKYKYNNT